MANIQKRGFQIFGDAQYLRETGLEPGKWEADVEYFTNMSATVAGGIELQSTPGLRYTQRRHFIVDPVGTDDFCQFTLPETGTVGAELHFYNLNPATGMAFSSSATQRIANGDDPIYINDLSASAGSPAVITFSGSAVHSHICAVFTKRAIPFRSATETSGSGWIIWPC